MGRDHHIETLEEHLEKTNNLIDPNKSYKIFPEKYTGKPFEYELHYGNKIQKMLGSRGNQNYLQKTIAKILNKGMPLMHMEPIPRDHDSELEHQVNIPINLEENQMHMPLNSEAVKELIKSNYIKKITLCDCVCRYELEKDGLIQEDPKNPKNAIMMYKSGINAKIQNYYEFPKDTCMSFETDKGANRARRFIRKGGAKSTILFASHIPLLGRLFRDYAEKNFKYNERDITKEEALKVIDEVSKFPLVHNAVLTHKAIRIPRFPGRKYEIEALCNCGKWCGAYISKNVGVKDAVMPLGSADIGEVLEITGLEKYVGFRAQINSDECNGCGSCADACHYKAIKEIEINGKKRYTVDLDNCMGCGVCTHVLASPENKSPGIKALCKPQALSFEKILEKL